jgi:hypothetical protein
LSEVLLWFRKEDGLTDSYKGVIPLDLGTNLAKLPEKNFSIVQGITS